MALPWPTTLPICAQTWEESDVPVTVRTEMEIGQPKVRRRYTRTMRMIRVSFIYTHAQAMALRNYFEIDLQGGVQEHTFIHPFLNTAQSFRFVEPPTIANEGALACNVSCAWEQL